MVNTYTNCKTLGGITVSIFDIFRNKNKNIEFDITKSINEYFGKQDQFKKLKKSEIPSIPNEDLRNAVMSWMWNKVDKDWDKQYEIINTLPKPCQYVYACCTIVDEVNNGGLNQLFFNSTEQFVKIAQDGFIAIGNVKLSKVIEEAIRVFNENKEKVDKYKDGSLESFSASYDENLFNKLDDDFIVEEPNFNSLLETYIRKNEEFFGD